MTELHRPLLTDETSYESNDGDILPIADITEPNGLTTTQSEVDDVAVEPGEPLLDPELAHKMGGILVDPANYEKDGDVLPLADIVEPDGFVAPEPVSLDVEPVVEQETADDSKERPKALTPTQIYDLEYDRLYESLENKNPDTATVRAKVIAQIGRRPEEPTA